MNCLYYIAPTLDSTHKISDDLHALGVKDFFMHVISKEDTDHAEHHEHHLLSSNYLETLDIIRDGFIGAALGFIAGLIGAGLLMFFEPFGPGVPKIVFVLIIAVVTMFGAWEGGLTGIASENKKLKKFRHDIDAGKYLILVYARKEQGHVVRSLMRTKHPEAELAAVDTHFINPFKPVRRRHPHGPGGNQRALQEE
jgi:hypothetical protein